VFKAEEKGFSHVVKRAGGKVLIDERAFFEWVEEQNAIAQGRGAGQSDTPLTAEST
tara:strand:+ start:653 stop:820 length:168 start_codon:yes stop_codon:yes gene_type:complete